MPRSIPNRPLAKHRQEMHAAQGDFDSAVPESAHQFGTAASEGRLTPTSPLDAMTVAFAAALDEVLRSRLERHMRDEPGARQLSRTVAQALGRELNMSPRMLMATVGGDRWVTLPDVLAALKRTSDFAPVFERHLAPLLSRWPYLLHKDPPGDPTLALSRGAEARPPGRGSVENTSNHDPRLKEADVIDLENQAREAIGLLAAAQRREEERGRALPSTVNWLVVASALDSPATAPTPLAADETSDRPRPGMRTPGAKTLPEFGIDSMNSTVREIFRDGKSLPAADIIARVQVLARERQIERGLEIEPVPDGSIRNALWRLHSQPADPNQRWLIRQGKTYQPGPRMLREKE